MSKVKISPFTRTPGIAGGALINTHFSDEIIANFESEESYKYVYKIVGLRGSGKSVEYSLVMDHFRKEKKWLVYALSAGGDPMQTLLSLMSRESFIEDKKVSKSIGTSVTAGGKIAVVNGNAGFNSSLNISANEHYYSAEAELKGMLSKAKAKGYKVLIGIDDIAKTDEMVRFLSVLGTVFMENDKAVRFICTGLAKNIEDFVNVPHLSFFVRNESIKIGPLDLHAISEKYMTLLGVTHAQAVKMARFTMGYAYGYQVLGEICFDKDKSDIDEEVEDTFDETIGSQYDLIWSTMTEAEQELIKIVVNTGKDSVSISDIKAHMNKEKGFTSLRDRLMKKHILSSLRRGTVSVLLPRFREYVNSWH